MRGMAIALGILVMLGIASILLAAPPGLQMFGLPGDAGGELVPGMGNAFSLDKIKCTLNVNCNMFG